MKFAFALLPIAVALRFVGASPVADEVLARRAPVPVTQLVCDGNTNQCTAFLEWGDGRWVAQWSTAVFHRGLFEDFTEEKMTSMAPVPVTSLNCDGNTYKCTANLDWGDGRWVAQWSTAVFHQALFHQKKFIGAMAPVPVTTLNCDGNTYQCTANLDYGDGGWIAEWSTAVFHNGL